MEWLDNPAALGLVGRKARGLSLFPAAWTPPFVVLSSVSYEHWVVEGSGSNFVLVAAAEAIELASREWRDIWPRGLILRSSAETETLEDRGTHESLRLAGDYGVSHVKDALERIFSLFAQRSGSGRLAVIVQPLVGEGAMGHLSNERRVSKTVNHWSWEKLSPDSDQGRLNSQRDQVPDYSKPLITNSKSLARAFGRVGRWVTQLRRGPAHLEWTYDGTCLWLLQIDFEADRPDDGVDPNDWLRDTDDRPSGQLPLGSPLSLVDLSPTARHSPWRKIENVRRFAESRPEPYPPLVSITGDDFMKSQTNERARLEATFEAFAHGRIVCRTDCRTEGVARENLPRTNTVTSAVAVDEMIGFLERMAEAGAAPEDVCFLAHKFIPARSGAWVRADPASTAVRVDCLWGVPDGLQYLPHDTFDCDVRRRKILAERLGYKHRFIQEGPDGIWRELGVRRSLARSRSLSTVDVVAIATASHTIASKAGRPLLIMWFCGIPKKLGIGQNLPWFSMPPLPEPALQTKGVSPRWPRLVLRTLDDVRRAQVTGVSKHILVLDPELALFRDDKNFLSAVIELATRNNCPVQLAGSTLAHAHYQLEKAGVSVVPADGSGRSRARGRRNFDKLVRDDMPAQIADGGELVIQSRLPHSEMRYALAAKLLEEVQELLAATDPDDVKAELADLLEVVRAMAEVTGVGWGEVETTAVVKRERRGGFRSGAVLVGTELPSAGRAAHKSPPMVTLRSLGKVVSEQGLRMVSYNALLAAPGESVEVEIEGRRVALRLTRDGILLTVGNDVGKSPAQFALPL